MLKYNTLLAVRVAKTAGYLGNAGSVIFIGTIFAALLAYLVARGRRAYRPHDVSGFQWTAEYLSVVYKVK